MPLLLSPWKRTQQNVQAVPEADPDIVELRRPDPATTLDRLLLLRPTEGGLAFRLYGFPDVESANGYVQQHLWLEAQQGVKAFWALHDEPAGSPEAADAVVIVRDPHHPGIVQIYSFTGMDAANEFVRQEFRNGIDLNLVLIYWAQSVDIERPPALASSQTPAHQYAATPALERSAHASPREANNGSGEPVEAKPMRAAPVRPAEAEPDEDHEEESEPSRLSVMAQDVMLWPGWDGLIPRMTQAMLLDEEVYEDLDRDRHATGRARLLIGLAIFAAGFGAVRGGFFDAFWTMAFAAVGWAMFAAMIYWFGTMVMPGHKTKKTFRHLIRAIGLAASPCVFLVLGLIPVFGAIAVIAVYVWIFLTTSRAISAPLQLDNQMSVVTAAFGILTLFAVSQVLPIVLV